MAVLAPEDSRWKHVSLLYRNLEAFFSGLAILGILELEAVMISSIGILHIIYYIFRCAMHTMSLRRSLPRWRESGSAVAWLSWYVVVFGLCGFAMSYSMCLCLFALHPFAFWLKMLASLDLNWETRDSWRRLISITEILNWSFFASLWTHHP